MIILKTSSTAQTLSVIPREYVSTFSMDIRDDSTNVTKVYEVTTATTVGNYLVFNNTFNPVLVEGHFYDLRLYIDYNIWNKNGTKPIPLFLRYSRIVFFAQVKQLIKRKTSIMNLIKVNMSITTPMTMTIL